MRNDTSTKDDDLGWLGKLSIGMVFVIGPITALAILLVTFSIPEAALPLKEQAVSANQSYQPSTAERSAREVFACDPLTVRDKLRQRIVGQDYAIDIVSREIVAWGAGLKPKGKPVGPFLFVGPTGVGKTALAKEIARVLYGSETRLTRIDMAEYRHAEDHIKLIGQDIGYKGHEAGGILTNAIEDQPRQVILLDEFEKAHPLLQLIFLSIFDEARIVNGQHKVIDFSEAVIILTSNLVADRIAAAYLKGMDPDEVIASVSSQMQSKFRPELYNRVKVVPFGPVERKHFSSLAEANLRVRAKEVKASTGLTLEWTAAVVSYLESVGYSKELGVRPLEREIEKRMIQPLGELILKGEARPGDTILYEMKQGVMTPKIIPHQE